MKRHYLPLLIAIGLFCLCGAEWRNFRGTGNDGVADTVLPKTCDEENIAWKVELPGEGVSSPIVVGGQVIVSASSGFKQDRLHVISLDARTGKVKWHRQFWATGRTLTHPTSANAAPTPASDGRHIVAFFSSNDVICLDLEGQLKWYRGLGADYPKAGNDIGMASSPVVAAGVVVCQAENQGDSFVEGMDLDTGESLWRLERPLDSNWNSPIHVKEDSDLVVLKNSESVAAHDIRTGEVVWRIDGEFGSTSSAVASGDFIYVPGSRFTVLDRLGDVATIAWDSQKIQPSTSPVIGGGQLFALNNAGVLSAFDAETGEESWKIRVGGRYWATPVYADGHLYLVNQAGEMNIVRVGDSAEKLDSHEFGEDVLGTPAAASGALYVRSDRHLWKVAARASQ